MIHFLIQVICAWCGADLGTKPGGDGISHGMCASCADKMRQEAQKGKGGK